MFALYVNTLGRQIHQSASPPTLFTGPRCTRIAAPCSADDFEVRLASKHAEFRPGDEKLLCSLYRSFSEAVLGAIEEFNFMGLGMNDEDMQSLAKALPHCKKLRTIVLSRNGAIGDKGIAALAKALTSGAAKSVREVYLQHLHPPGPEATLALRACSSSRDTMWFL